MLERHDQAKKSIKSIGGKQNTPLLFNALGKISLQIIYHSNVPS
jgi:hypothetical protein